MFILLLLIRMEVEIGIISNTGLNVSVILTLPFFLLGKRVS